MIDMNGKRYVKEEYPDGTRKMQAEALAPRDEGYVKINWYYDSENELIDLFYIVKHLNEIMPHTPIGLYMPYIPQARADRVYHDNEVFTLKYFASVINELGFEKVIAVDPHSHVSEALINRFCADRNMLKRLILQAVLSTHMKISYRDFFLHYSDDEYLKQYTDLTICYPDEGAMKRYTDLVSNPYVFGIKKRDWKTGSILGLDIMGDPALIEGKNILIVDDICSKGGTFYHTSKKLKEMGAAKVFLYVTHCENTIFDGELLKDNGLIDRIFTTNSIFRGDHEKIEVFKL